MLIFAKTIDFFKHLVYNKSRGDNMVTVFDVAKYILEQQGEMSAMKLQKLCYYAQAWSLVWDDKPLFDEEFRAWRNGPVCYELFAVSRGKFLIKAEDEPGDSSKLNDTQKTSINVVLTDYGPHDAQWLSILSHSEDPWKEAFRKTSAGETPNEIITKDSMAVYYGGLNLDVSED